MLATATITSDTNLNNDLVQKLKTSLNSTSNIDLDILTLKDDNAKLQDLEWLVAFIS